MSFGIRQRIHTLGNVTEGSITPDEREGFERDGYLIRTAVFSQTEVAQLAAAFERLTRRADQIEVTTKVDGATFVLAPTGVGSAPRVQRVVWCGSAEPELLRPALDPRVLGPALDLLEAGSADQLVNQAHFKLPGDGVAFPLHQDAWNRRFGTALWRDRTPKGYIQTLLTIDEMRTDNGPLVVIPGSHRHGALIGLDRQAKVETIAAQTPPQPILAPTGSLVFFGPCVVHGSAPNEGSKPRRVLVNGYARPGVNRRQYPGAGLGVRRSLPQSAGRVLVGPTLS